MARHRLKPLAGVQRSIRSRTKLQGAGTKTRSRFDVFPILRTIPPSRSADPSAVRKQVHQVKPKLCQGRLECSPRLGNGEQGRFLERQGIAELAQKPHQRTGHLTVPVKGHNQTVQTDEQTSFRSNRIVGPVRHGEGRILLAEQVIRKVALTPVMPSINRNSGALAGTGEFENVPGVLHVREGRRLPRTTSQKWAERNHARHS